MQAVHGIAIVIIALSRCRKSYGVADMIRTGPLRNALRDFFPQQFELPDKEIVKPAVDCHAATRFGASTTCMFT